MNRAWITFGVVLVLALHGVQGAEDKAPEDLKPDTAEANLGAAKQGSRTDDEVIWIEAAVTITQIFENIATIITFFTTMIQKLILLRPTWAQLSKDLGPTMR